MPVPESTNRVPGALLSALRELADADGTCSPTIRQLADVAECSERSVRRGLLALETAGCVTVTRSRDGVTPSQYAVSPLTGDPMSPLTSADLSPLTLACARDRSEPFSSLSASDNGDRRAHTPAPPPAPTRARLAAPTEPQEQAMPARNPDAPGQVAIIAAVAAAETAKKPPLDEAAKRRIGSVAKRMHAGGVTLDEIRAAAVYLVQRGMSDLQAAHRGRLELEAAAIVGDALHDRAMASVESRRGLPRHAITLAEVDEAWLMLRLTWPRVELPPPDAAQFWVDELKPIPIDFVNAAIRQWGRRTDGQGQWPPTVLQVYTVARKLYGDYLLEAKLEAQRAIERKAQQEHEAWRAEQRRAAGDATDPRAEA